MTAAALASDGYVRTGEAARLLGCSRQHVVDLCSRGALPSVVVGTHRRIPRAAISSSLNRGSLGREQLRSLWIHRLVAAKVIENPERAIAFARRNLATLSNAHPRGPVRKLLSGWEGLLNGPLEVLLEALTASDQHTIELRQNSPFAGLLTDRERARVLTSFAAARTA